ncbi:hypothetical protein CAPTEDRAFT_131552, partial [Capitella teleta]
MYDKLLTLFLDARLDPTEPDCHGASLLHHAAGSGSCKALERLIGHCGQHSVNNIDIYKSTPLHYAVAANQKETAEILMRSGSNKDARDCKGRTALDLAKLFGSENIMQLL